MKKRIVVLVSILTILLSGCITMRMETQINRDGSGVHSIIIAFDKELTEGSSGSTEDYLEDMDMDMLQEQIPGAKVEAYSEKDVEGFKMSIPFKSLDELKSPNTGDIGAMFESLALSQDGETWTFKVVFSSESENELGLDEETLRQLEGLDAEELGIEVTYAIQMDGKVLSYSPKTGGKVKGGKVTWDLVKVPSDTQEFVVKWGPGGESDMTTMLLVAVAAGGVLLVIVGAIMTARSKPSSQY